MFRTTSEISQSSPAHSSISGLATDPQPSFVPGMQRLAKLFRALMDIRLAEIGLVSGQDQMLDALPEGEAISVSAVAQTLCVRPSTISKMIDRLVEKGLMQRCHDPNDARTTLVALTKDGIGKQGEVRRIWRAVESELCCASADEGDNRSHVLGVLEAQVAKRLARLR